MTDAVTVGLIAAAVTLIGYVGKSLKWFYDLSKEQGRAEAYRTASEAAITAKNTELNEARLTIEDKDRTIAFLRDQLRARTEATS